MILIPVRETVLLLVHPEPDVSDDSTNFRYVRGVVTKPLVKREMMLDDECMRLNEQEPWITSIRAGSKFTLPQPANRAGSLAAKQQLVMRLMELGLGCSFDGKTSLDIGSNQGYTSLEASIGGG